MNWNTHIKELTDEASEIIYNANMAAREMQITAQQRDEVLKIVLKDVADQAGIQQFGGNLASRRKVKQCH